MNQARSAGWGAVLVRAAGDPRSPFPSSGRPEESHPVPRNRSPEESHSRGDEGVRCCGRCSEGPQGGGEQPGTLVLLLDSVCPGRVRDASVFPTFSRGEEGANNDRRSEGESNRWPWPEQEARGRHAAGAVTRQVLVPGRGVVVRPSGPLAVRPRGVSGAVLSRGGQGASCVSRSGSRRRASGFRVGVGDANVSSRGRGLRRVPDSKTGVR